MELASVDVEVPGTILTEGKMRDQILNKIRELCGWRQKSFPGSQPVSLSKTNLQQLGRSYYVAGEKTDGVRFLMFAASNMVCLVDRREEVRMLPTFFLPRELESLEAQQLTLLDGEMVTDEIKTVGENGEIQKRLQTRYLIYDAISIMRDRHIARMNLIERLRQTYIRVLAPRIAYEEANPEKVAEEKSGNSFIPIYMKDFFEVWDIAAITMLGQRLPHFCDGIIFTPVYAAYQPGTCQALMKWKPPHLNTVDFRADIMQLTEEEATAREKVLAANGYGPIQHRLFGVKLMVGEQGIATWKGNLWLSHDGEFFNECIEGKKAERNLGYIYESKWDNKAITVIPEISWSTKLEAVAMDWSKAIIQTGSWVVDRIRTDRDTPNDIRVVKKVFESIQDGTTFLDLLEEVAKFRQSKKVSVSSRVLLNEDYERHGSKFGIEDMYREPKAKKAKMEKGK